MVSLRRKKLKASAEGAQRKSSRLLAMEELKTENAVLALPVDFQHVQDNRKRGRKKAIEAHEEKQTSQEPENVNGDPLNSQSSSNSRIKRVIGYILDMLEVKDRLDLFSMPENLQTYDYEDSMSNPGYFAMVRQKFMDGMYISLDHFENDVLTLFRKALDLNAPESTPYREATSMRDEAKKIFQSLRNNFTYAELELANWHQHYFKYKRRAVRNDGNIGISSHNVPTSSRHAVSNDIKRGNGTDDVTANGRTHSRNGNKTTRRNPKSKASSRPRGNKEAAAKECRDPKSPDEQQRCTYKPASVLNDSLLEMIRNPPVPLVYNNKSIGYQESLRHFVKDAGPTAKFIAEKKCLEYAQRVNPQPIWKPPPFGSASKIGALGRPPGGASNSSAFGNYGPGSTSSSRTRNSSSSHADGQDSGAFEFQSCPLDTNMLLTLCSCIGKPEFLERSSVLKSKQDLGFDPKPRFSSILAEMGATQYAIRSMPQTCTGNDNLKFQSQEAIKESSIWQQPRLKGSKPRFAAEAFTSTASVIQACYEKGNGSFPWTPINLND